MGPEQKRPPGDLVMTIKRIIYAGIYLSLSFIALNVYSETEQIGPFGPLNNTDNPFIISSNQSQDLLNVETTDGNKSLKKRKGYGTAFTLSNATSPVHGVYNFYDTNGSDVCLFFNDRRMNVSVSGASPSVFFSTGTNGATYQCVDSAGFAYCANTSRDAIIKVNSSTYTLLSGFTSTGTMVTVTPERLVQAGFSSNTSLVWFSKANDFATWTVGGNPTDPITFIITSPGSGIKHITYAHGRVYWFKDASFGYILEGASQGDWQVVTVSNFLGTLYNTSIFRDDILYFQGNDGHFYAYDGSSLAKLSKDIQGTINQTQGRASNSWTQTTQSQFEAGYIDSGISSTLFTNTLSNRTTDFIVNNKLQFSSWTFLNFDSTSISTGVVHDTYTFTNAIATIFPDTFTYLRDGSSGKPMVWKDSVSGVGGLPDSYSLSNNQLTFNIGAGGSPRFNCYKAQKTLQQGTTLHVTVDSINHDMGFNTFGFTNNQASGAENYMTLWRQATGYYCASAIGRTTGAEISITSACTPTFPFDAFFYVSTDTYQVTVGTTSVRRTVSAQGFGEYYYPVMNWAVAGGSNVIKISRFDVVPDIFYSKALTFDTFITSHTYGNFTANLTTPTGSSINFMSNASTSSTLSGSYTAMSSGSVPTTGMHRYVNEMSYFSRTSTTSQPAYLSNLTIPIYSTGTYFSAVNNAPSLTSWDSLSSNYSVSGGSISFYTRSSTGSFVVRSTWPTWVETPVGGIPTSSAAAYFQVRTDFNSHSSTDSILMYDFTQNWFEGSAADKTYAIYHDNYNWWSVASGTGATTNNKILRFNLIDPGWYIFDIGTGGMYVRNQSLYFGSVAAGKVYKYGDVDNDDSAAINAYWESKDFFGASPFLDKDYSRMSSAWKTVSNSTATLTYIIDGSSATAYNVNLGSATSSFIQKNINLPQGKTGKTISVKYGNNAADQYFEIFGGAIDYTPKSWNPK